MRDLSVFTRYNAGNETRRFSFSTFFIRPRRFYQSYTGSNRRFQSKNANIYVKILRDDGSGRKYTVCTSSASLIALIRDKCAFCARNCVQVRRLERRNILFCCTFTLTCVHAGRPCCGLNTQPGVHIVVGGSFLSTYHRAASFSIYVSILQC